MLHSLEGLLHYYLVNTLVSFTKVSIQCYVTFGLNTVFFDHKSIVHSRLSLQESHNLRGKVSMFWRKNWHWLLALIVVFGVGGFILLKPKPPNTDTKKVFIVPDFDQVREDTSNNTDKISIEQKVNENVETQVENSPIKTDDITEISTESPTDDISLGDDEDGVTPNAETTDWRTALYGESPYGYGPYPEIPSDFPEMYRPIWTLNVVIQNDEVNEQIRTRELLSRVRIKLWNQGRTDVTGIHWHPSTNKVYPCTPDTVYVKYKGIGTSKRISSVFSGPDIPNYLLRQIMEGEKPAGIQILNQESNGFDLYQFLGL